MSEENKNVLRIAEFDIIKAIGIISIVIGHCIPDTTVIVFVYSYHLALFLFVSGMQFNIEKYSKNPSLFLQNRIRSMWPGYFLYMTFFTITHNIAVKFGLLTEENYGIEKIMIRILNNFVFCGGETLGGALWFVPVMLIALLLFSVSVYISYTYFYKYRIILIIILNCIMGSFGLYCNLNGMQLMFNMHTGLLLLPVILGGFLITYFHMEFNKIFRGIFAIICFCVIWVFVKSGYQIELSVEMVGSKILFYPVTFCGIYFVCYVAKLINKISWGRKIFLFIGKNSFDIMALHFLVFKCIDVCYGNVRGDLQEVFGIFPCAYSGLWAIYLLASIFFIPWIRHIIDKMVTTLKDYTGQALG